MSSKPRTDILPILALLATATFWGLLWYPMRWLAAHGVPGLWGTGVSFAAALAVGSPLLWRYRSQLKTRPKLLLGLILANGWCNTAFILAVLDGQVVRVILLFYLSPIWAVLLARLFLGERMPSAAWFTLLVAMVGALIILWQPSLGVPWPRNHSDWLAISSGLGFAVSNVFIRMGQDLATGLKAVIAWLGVTLLSGLLLLAGAGGEAEWSVTPLVVALLLGAVGIVLMSVCLVFGVSRMPVHRSAVILLFEVLVGAVSAQWLAHESLGVREWLGGGLILVAGWLTSRQQLQD
ncbi:MAG: DMT family transporter [Gammaproteobacteria bacterium]|jgi:drug/metabolite transporter (DMT)-like permease